MRRMGGSAIIFGCMLACVTLGCRTPHPDLKPPKEPEVISVPPALTQYDSPNYPKQCFEDRSVPKRIIQSGQPIMPAGGVGGGMPGMGGGMNGMGR